MGERQSYLRYALLGGIVSGATIGLPVLDLLNCLCCAGVMLGGFLGVFFALKDQEEGALPMERADALQVGVLSGVVGAVVGTVLHAVTIAVAGDVVREMISSMLLDGDVRNSVPPPIAEMLEEALADEGGVTALSLVVHLMVWILIGPLFGLFGGLIGYSLLTKDKPQPPIVSFPPEVSS